MEESIARKLAVPKKLSAWERDKQAAEAKKQQQEAETAAALRDFQKSLGVDSDEDLPPSSRPDRGLPSGPKSKEPSRRHGPGFPYGPGRPKSGPGSLGPVEGHDLPPNLKRKRALDEAKDANWRRSQEETSRPTEDERRPEPEYEAPKPTIYLQSLPPSISIDELKALLTPHLKVHSIRFVERQSLTAIATLTSDTNLSQIDNAIRSLKDRYLSCGHRLSISRFDESAFSRKNNEPFGASLAETTAYSMNNAPPPDERGFDRRYNDRRSSQRRQMEVKVSLPLNISTVQAIHTIADRLLSMPDPDSVIELEALLMKLPEVQSDERFSFLYDSSSPAGVYYRLCLWSRSTEHREPERLHDDLGTIWNISTQGATFPNLTDLSQVVTDIDYASSEDESDNEDERKRPADRLEPENLLVDNERNFMLPLQHARLTHLLARLPTANTRLRTGDVARVTAFAIRHAGNGAEQIVDKLLLNADMPFARTAAGKHEDISSESDEELHDADGEPQTKQDDSAGARLVALYVISDILSASATAGARNSWKYRQLFEAGFQRQMTFEKLGKIDQELGWGRMKMEQFKRKISAILDLWEAWAVFSADVLQSFRRALTGEPEPEAPQVEEHATEAEIRKPKWMTQVKTADKREKDEHLKSITASAPAETDVDVEMRVEDASKGKLPPEQQPQIDDKVAEAADTQEPAQSTTEIRPSEHTPAGTGSESKLVPASTAPKKRMRAEDMFADSDDEKP